MRRLNEIVSANGDEPFGEDEEAAVEKLLSLMESMTQSNRVVVFQILSDFYCPQCGIEQPEGDCQCDD